MRIDAGFTGFNGPPEKMLAFYRKRGKAEAHMGGGEVSARRAPLLGGSSVQDVITRNEVSLLLSLYAC